MSNPIILRAQAARCFRLAKGAASPRLADELEALGRVFEQEALELEIYKRAACQGNSRVQHGGARRRPDHGSAGIFLPRSTA
jgi:hypothetical protein